MEQRIADVFGSLAAYLTVGILLAALLVGSGQMKDDAAVVIVPFWPLFVVLLVGAYVFFCFKALVLGTIRVLAGAFLRFARGQAVLRAILRWLHRLLSARRRSH